MADRTIKLETANKKTSLRPFSIAFAVIAVLTIIRYALPTPPERIRTTQVSDEDVILFVKNTLDPRLTSGEHPASSLLGETIFNDNDFLPYQPGRQGNNESCNGCHQSGNHDSSYLTSERQASDLRRSKFYNTFSTDGRAKDLATFIAQHLESQKELASNRIRIVKLISTKYRDQYQKEFGPLPSIDISKLPDNGLPAIDRKEFPIVGSSFILETISDRHQLANILSQAQIEHIAPAVIVSRIVFSPMIPPHELTEPYLKLAPQQQAEIDKIFFNSVQALTAYVKSLKQPEVAYDRFAEAIGSGHSLEQSLSTEFGPEELTGLRLFYGHAGCARCHNGPGFTDNKFHNIGLPSSGVFDAGRAIGLVLAERKKICAPLENAPSEESCHLEEPSDDDMKAAIGAFRTTALRGFIADGTLTHTGQISGLEDMVAFYDQLNDRPAIGHRTELLIKLDLTKEEENSLYAFLRAISANSSIKATTR